MRNLSLKNRIALNYILSTAILTGIIFFAIFFVLERQLAKKNRAIMLSETSYYMDGIVVNADGSLVFNKPGHTKPDDGQSTRTYIEIVDASGEYIYKSPGLESNRLRFIPGLTRMKREIVEFGDIHVMQIQKPIAFGDHTAGYLLVAIPFEESAMALHELGHVLILLYPLILVILFFIARLIANNSIRPISKIIAASDSITYSNLSSRIPLPERRDELYKLSETINNLLDRIEHAMEREKSFTSYASHEFRTPLAVLKGTMEVLIRKKRDTEKYEEKIRFCISEVDRLNSLVEKLLLLSRCEDGGRTLKSADILVEDILSNSLGLLSDEIVAKKLRIATSVLPGNVTIVTDEYLFSTIITNLLSNAVKYSDPESTVEIAVFLHGETLICEIKNTGAIIPQEEQDMIFEKFYRSYSADIKVKGFGLGLPIVKRFCSLLNIGVEISSLPDKTTSARLIIPGRLLLKSCVK